MKKENQKVLDRIAYTYTKLANFTNEEAIKNRLEQLYNLEEDDVIEMILMPVIVETATSTSTGATSVTNLKPLTQLAATTIRSGKNPHSPMRLKILYNGF